MPYEQKTSAEVGSGSQISVWIFLAAFVFVFYGMGAAFVESFVNYPTWRLIGTAEFQVYHRALAPLVIGFLVVPMAVTLILTALLLWKRPPLIPKWTVWSALTMQVIAAVSSIAVQIPIQTQLSGDGLSLELIDRLIVTNFWLRRVPLLINSILFLWMITLLLRRPADSTG
jgi:hypothetical protein